MQLIVSLRKQDRFQCANSTTHNIILLYSRCEDFSFFDSNCEITKYNDRE
jgi:hypothetical protein